MSSELQAVTTLSGLALAIISLYIAINKNRSDVLYKDVEQAKGLENRITQLETQLGKMTPINDRVVALETKMGLFWNMVEHLTQVTPIMHTSKEQMYAARIYDEFRAKSPTWVLRILGDYLAEKIKDADASPDERILMLLKLGAIQAQLIDRKEPPIDYN